MMMTTECVIIGGGVIGLAIARSLSAKGVECVVLEKNKGFGMETSSRNSEVIHRYLRFGAAEYAYIVDSL
jgi:L-2-hydroxyglutarate oxidase LhgO